MLQAGDELGNKYAGAHKKKSRQSRGASVLTRTINLCLFQSWGRQSPCKIPAGMSSISVNLSIPLCVGSGLMDWFCHFCSVHSMLTWKSAGRLWGKVIAVLTLTLTSFSPVRSWVLVLWDWGGGEHRVSFSGSWLVYPAMRLRSFRRETVVSASRATWLGVKTREEEREIRGNSPSQRATGSLLPKYSMECWCSFYPRGLAWTDDQAWAVQNIWAISLSLTLYSSGRCSLWFMIPRPVAVDAAEIINNIA